MIEEINEPIQVVAKFDKSKLYPLCFSWRGRNYQIQRIEFTHSYHQGKAKLYYISCKARAMSDYAQETSAGRFQFFSGVCTEANYQLVFNSLTFAWRLDKIELPGT